MNEKRSFLNDIILWLSRPWVLILGIGFICIPTTKMSEALETGAEFLRIDTDARVVSMGSTFAASAEGVNSMMYNPAMMSTVKNTEFGFSHTKWLLDSSHNFIGFAMPIKSQRVEAGSLKDTKKLIEFASKMVNTK